MAGIYVHIPFCKQACTYCDFHFSTSLKLADRVIDAMVTEIKLRRDEIKSPLKTIYFGGGTPGILEVSQIEKLLKAIQTHFDVHPDVEFTLENNPDDTTQLKCQGWADLGVNRLSIGIQSFSDWHLSWMNRAHNAAEAKMSIQNAIYSGITNLNIDLIYGIPGMRKESWEENLSKAVDLGVKHISAYCLTVEPGTVLGHLVNKGEEKPVDDEAASEQFEFMVDFLEKHGIKQYEVSNFAVPGSESRHNSAYWAGAAYTAIGPSAHGFTGHYRYWNIANNARYCQAIESNKLPQTVENLSRDERYNEFVMTGLRTTKGIDLERIKTNFNVDLRREFEAKMKQIIEDGSAKIENNILSLTKKGMFLADGIAADFFILEHEN
ncbi:MAG: radical SAM family heme chaperone HemW [Flavobacteriales bacterium]|nr:radical SAM family heme chaperone HemW [Flavobacteriales bacterium]